MSEDQMTGIDHDDGLVHEHAWAAADRGAALHAEATRIRAIEAAEAGHDDGLVHDHVWARGDAPLGGAARQD